jgi:hypothetical protein
MWGTVSAFLGAKTRPFCFTQYFWWIPSLLPGGPNMHVVTVAALCWDIWKTRNRAFFGGKMIKSPVDMICYMCAFLRYWSGLQEPSVREDMVEGVQRPHRMALKMHELVRRNSTLRIKVWCVTCSCCLFLVICLKTLCRSCGVAYPHSFV